MEKVSEYNIRITSLDHNHISRNHASHNGVGHNHVGHNHAGPLPPAVTIIKKGSSTKFLIEPMLSPLTGIEQTAAAASCLVSPFGNPLCASTPQNATGKLITVVLVVVVVVVRPGCPSA